jgi:beta-xylosidase
MNDHYIICGSLHEYHNYCKKQGAWDVGSDYRIPDSNTRFKFVSSPHALIGIIKPKGILTGTWYNRKDINEILDRLVLQGSFDINKHDQILIQRNQILGINPDLSNLTQMLKKHGTPITIQP